MRRGSRLLRGVLAVWAVAASAMAQATPLAELKAAYLYNFALYVTWPGEPLQAVRLCAPSPLPEEESASLARLDGRKVRGMPLRVVVGGRRSDLLDCHMIYLDQTGDAQVVELRRRTSVPVLWVASGERAASQGADIGLFVDHDGRLAFDLNLGTLRQAGLRASSRLLPLARRTY